MFPQMVECGIIAVMKTNAILSLAAAIALAGCTSSSLPYRESGTDFAAKALAPWVEKG
jgi:predicted lipoprotein